MVRKYSIFQSISCMTWMQDLELLFDMQMSSYRELKDSDTIIVRSRNKIFFEVDARTVRRS